ncbi:MAG: SpoIIE family protein phosphatase [Spirochaetaceae bacterium]|jgi:sigma-B regulation protein RsbU (phosphoserine phosphatase)|nr:SpoIIE family protein phosphatase [Spirochaetaceae bacterium]
MIKKIFEKILLKFDKQIVEQIRGDTMQSRILVPTLITSLVSILLIAAPFFGALFWIRSVVIHNADEMGETAFQISSHALEQQLKENLVTRVYDLAGIIDERLNDVKNLTKLVASNATDYYTKPMEYRPRFINRAKDGDNIGNGAPNLYFSRGCDTPSVVREAAIGANIIDVFEQVFSLAEDITASYIAGESGYLIIVRNEMSTFTNYDARKRLWYLEAEKRNELTWSPVYLDSTGRFPTVTCAAPYYDNSGAKPVLKGIAGNGVLLKNFRQIIEDADPGEETTVFLLEKTGRKLFSSDNTGIKVDPYVGGFVSENLLESPNEGMRELARNMINGEDGLMEIHFDKSLNYIAYCPLDEIDWSLAISIDEQKIKGNIISIQSDINVLVTKIKKASDNMLFLMFILLFIVGLAIIVFRIFSVFELSRKIVLPLAELAQYASVFDKDSLTKEISLDVKALELRQLVASFNEMKRRIRQYISDLSKTTAEKERMSTELDIASKIQISMLPSSFTPQPNLPDFFEIDAKMFPAKEVGGDFYDFFFIDKNRFAVVVGDVSGKGVSAAMFMVVAKTLIKNHLQAGLSPELAISKLNIQLCDSNKEGLFVTMWAGVFNPYNGKIEYVNAGHNPPLVKSGSYSFRYVTGIPHDLVVGVMETAEYHKRVIHLAKDDALFLYTDGITEAFNNNDVMYGEERLSDFLNTHYDLSLKDILSELRNDIKEFAGAAEQSDDITMLALRYKKEQKNEIEEPEEPEELSDLPESLDEIL